MQTHEEVVQVHGGWTALWISIVSPFLLAWMMYFIIASAISNGFGIVHLIGIIVFSLLVIGWSICLAGFYTLQPNESAVLVLFGRYVGTDKTSGFRWANPFYKKIKVSLRACNLNMDVIKVNDLRGNPIEIAAVVVWRVANTAEAIFDVDSYEHYVSVQSESALRHLAMAYPYDDYGDEPLSLRGSTDEVSNALQGEIQNRVNKAGVEVIEAKLSHLAYAQEIAAVMLQRQQAEAIVAARARIVEGAVGMVEMALKKLEETKTVELDEERKAAMVSNLLVVLCGRADAHPVINTGTLYN